MNRNHNPITLIIEDFQNHWAKEISPFSQIKMVGWLIKPEDADIYDGFLKVENSEHGKLEEGFHPLYTPFDDEESFSRALISSCIEGIQADKKTLKHFADHGISIDFKEEHYIKSPSPSPKDDVALLSLFDDIKNCIGGDEMKLVFAITPRYIRKSSGFRNWLKRIYKAGIPKNIRILFFDDVNRKLYDEIIKYAPTENKNFHVPADLQKAVEQIARTAQPGNPQSGFTALLLKMGDAAKNDDFKKVEFYANEAISLAIKHKNLGMQATVSIMHCGLLFANKDYAKMIALLDKGQKVLNKAKETEDVAEPSLQIQYYAYYSMTYFHTKKFDLALDYALKQAQACIDNNMESTAISIFNQASDIAVKHAPERNVAILEHAYDTAKNIAPESINYSETIFICQKIHMLHSKDYANWKQEANQWMEDLYGTDWQSISADKTAYYKTITEQATATI